VDALQVEYLKPGRARPRQTPPASIALDYDTELIPAVPKFHHFAINSRINSTLAARRSVDPDPHLDLDLDLNHHKHNHHHNDLVLDRHISRRYGGLWACASSLIMPFQAQLEEDADLGSPCARVIAHRHSARFSGEPPPAPEAASADALP
jgi:hypothetical protein